MPETSTMPSLTGLAKAGRWDDLDKAWQAATEHATAPSAELLTVLEAAVKGGKSQWAEASAWAWLSQTKEKATPATALQLARQLLLRLNDGGELRKEVLELYRQTHPDVPSLDKLIDMSGLAGPASVRKALRFLDVAVELKPGAFVLHRTDDVAAEVVQVDLAADEVELRLPRGASTLNVSRVVEEYHAAAENDFRVLRQLRPDHIQSMAKDDPLRLVIGILRSHGGRIDRDQLRLLLVPRYVDVGAWSNWWTGLRNAVKKSPHVTIEGRSPMFLIHHEAGRTLEEETRETFARAATPRELLSVVEDYLRECKSRKATPDEKFLHGLAGQLDARVKKLAKHDPDAAFATALVIERLAQEGLPLPPDVPGIAVRMLEKSDHPATMILSAPELALWPLALACTQQALPQRWPAVFAALLPKAPASQCDTLAREIETAGHGPELLPPAVERILADPVAHVEALMWLWKGPSVKTTLAIPPLMDLFGRIMKLVGPARDSAKGASAEINALRAAVRSGMSSRGYARLRSMMEGHEEAMGAALRRQVERAEGLGPVVQDEMINIIREYFPRLFLRARIEPWDDPNVILVTEAGQRKREAELNELVNVKLRENAIAIGKAIEHGDLSENSEYKFALEERDLLQARVAQIQMEMSLARVLSAGEVSREIVSVGHRVRLTDVQDQSERLLTILGPWESDLSAGVFSYQAPMVRVLLGKKPGDLVKLPSGESGAEREFRIASFETAI